MPPWEGQTIMPAVASQLPQPTRARVPPVSGQATMQQIPTGKLQNPEAPKPPMPEMRPIPLTAPMITLGRYPDNMVILNHPQVSAHHARLERLNDGAYRIFDLHSTNHVYVNEQRVRKQVLKPGDEIAIGPYEMIYTGTELTSMREGRGIRIEALHLKTSGKRFRVLLHDISLDIPSGSFVALLGGSGVGKSTLLDALSGVRPARRGTVLYNGQDYYQHMDAFNTKLGYLPQEDIVHRRLTVQKALYYEARLRLPSDFTRGQIKERVDEVLDEVEMTHRRRSIIRNLSGGERKRVSLALELLANPSVFFLDEPGASLDPGLDLKLMQLLRKLANKGHTIVLVTHSTTNVDLCDRLCFLASGGRLAFYGSPDEAKEYFGTANYAEIYNALGSTDDNPNTPAEAEERFKKSPYYQQYIVGPLTEESKKYEQALESKVLLRPPQHENSWQQFSLLSRRYIRLLKNDVGNLLVLLLQAPVIGLILFYLTSPGTFNPASVVYCPLRSNPVNNTGPIVSVDCQKVVDLLNTPAGTAYAQQQGKSKQQLLQQAILDGSGETPQTVLFIMAFAAVLFGCINGSREIVKEAPIYRRERMVNLGIAPYMFSKIVVLGVLCLVQSAIVIYLVNLKAPLHQGIFLPIFAEIYITMALTSLAGLMLGLAISAIASNADRAMSLVPLVLIPQVIFSGTIFKLDTPILQAVGALFAMRWAMAGMGSSIGLHADKLGVDNFSYQGTLFVSMNPASAVPGAITHLLIVWGALAAMIIVLMLAIAYFLKWKDVRA
jgi:ABC-type multidrug transport system ATPase subunit